ncbi:MAG: FAD-binding oxidoreductase [Actinobacteria bacterium]|nr:FAD-binding oxidoreductase [Actinomycetota bacterium]
MATVRSSLKQLLPDLVEVVGPDHVLSDPDLKAPYESDWTGRWHGNANVVIRPGTTSQVSAVMGILSNARVAVVPQGGNTGLVGGGVPRGGEAVISLRRLDHLGPVDKASAQVNAGAGVTLARLQAHARAAGLLFGVDLAARDSATIGGMVATNAGGIHVLRYGMMRAQVG